MKSQPSSLYHPSLWVIAAFAAGLNTVSFADPNHPTVPQPGPPENWGQGAPATYKARSYPKIEALWAKRIKGEATDEALSGKTFIYGTPVTPRTDYCFPAEPRDVFWQMDQIVWKTGKLEPLNFDEDDDGVVSNEDRNGIRGRNTWLLWGGGNETFWGWLQERAYGLTDFLILMDSRQRATRFRTAGVINQPGFASSTTPLLGLYLDQPRDGKWENAMLTLPPGPDGKPLLAARKSGYDYIPEPDRYDAQKRTLPEPVYQPTPPAGHPTQLFEAWTTPDERKKAWESEKKEGADPYGDYVPDTVRKKLPQDGLDPDIYGYPSGIFGLRLMLNPDFFAKTKDAARARSYWKERVESTNGRYYTDTSIHSDPMLVRPFRVAMSCGFCHVAQHPLNPPLRDDEPEWENLSSIIGAQYWDPQPANGNLLKRPNFLHHFLMSQAPGTIDTSLVSSDHINNTNVINPIFDVPARLKRALEKPTETQSHDNLLLPSIEDPETGNNPNGNNKERHFPMVLGPGEDSVGIFGALERVPHNVGVFSENWQRTGNLVLGYTPQRPFRLEVGEANSVYWNVNVKYRVPYMAAFFDLGRKGKVGKSTAAMKLKYAMEIVRGTDDKPILDAQGKPQRAAWGDKLLTENSKKQEEASKIAAAAAKTPEEAAKEPENKLEEAGKKLQEAGKKLEEAGGKPGKAAEEAGVKKVESPAGRNVFLDNCAICHSSKQPKRYDLDFKRKTPPEHWEDEPAPKVNAAGWLVYTLPMDYVHWEDFKKSPSYKDYLTKLRAMPEVAGGPPANGAPDPFIEDNFLSNELRIPITLTGTYSGRAMATNAMRGNVWDNYSSEKFKNLASVGNIRYFNAYKPDAKFDPFGTNDQYSDGRTHGGPGYFRPATLISIWASAPFFHNNALGIYTHDTSVKGRLLAFDDAIRKLLWNSQRPRYEREWGSLWPGHEHEKFAYVSPGDLRASGSAAAANDPGYIYRLPVDTRVTFQPGFTPLLLQGLLIGFTGIGFGKFLFTVLSFWWWVLLVVLYFILIFKGRPRHVGILFLVLAVLIAAVSGLLGIGSYCLWLVVAVLAVSGFLLLFTICELKWLVRLTFVVATVVTLFVGILTNKFLTGHLKQVHPLLAVLPNSWLNADYKGIDIGPIPRGTPVNLIMSLDPAPANLKKVGPALVALVRSMVQINQQHLTGEEAYKVLAKVAGQPLIDASKCPDFVLDRGHWFGEGLSDSEKEALIAFLKTL